jgi:hypothetical protein
MLPFPAVFGTRVKRRLVGGIAALLLFLPLHLLAADPANANEYAAIDAIFSEHCLDCHAAQDPEGKFVLESFDTLMQGGELGPALVPGKSADSLLVKMIEGAFEKDGKKKIMPPGKRKKLPRRTLPPSKPGSTPALMARPREQRWRGS